LKVLFDQNVPRPLARFLKAHDVAFARDLGLVEVKNGKLLSAAEAASFDVLLSGDKTMRHKQNMIGRKIALVYMSDNHWPIVKDHVPAIIQAIEQVKSGEVRAVYCGTFVPASPFPLS
jgi:predicted nuclease of predicted toxin-antitoxin system